MNLEELNQGDSEQACIELLKCCGSSQWTEKMLAARPYNSVSHLLELAGQIWSDLGEIDYLEAFAAHPKIGASKPPDNAKNTESWTGKEQAGMMSAGEQTKLNGSQTDLFRHHRSGSSSGHSRKVESNERQFHRSQRFNYWPARRNACRRSSGSPVSARLFCEKG